MLTRLLNWLRARGIGDRRRKRPAVYGKYHPEVLPSVEPMRPIPVKPNVVGVDYKRSLTDGYSGGVSKDYFVSYGGRDSLFSGSSDWED